MRLEELERKLSFFENATGFVLKINRHKWNLEKKTVDGFGVVKSKIFFTLFGDFDEKAPNREDFVYTVIYNIRDNTLKPFYCDREIGFRDDAFVLYLKDVISEYYLNVILPEIYGNMNLFSAFCERESKFIKTEVF